jgi:LysM repeat protein
MQRHLTLIGMVFLLAAIVISNSSGDDTAQSRSLPFTPLNPLPTVAPPTLVDGFSHTVRTGETLYGIAQQYGVSMEALVSANRLPDQDTIYVGQTLVIPGVTEVVALPPSTAEPIVAPTPMPTELPTSGIPTPVEVTTIPLSLLTDDYTPLDLGILRLSAPVALNGIALESIVVMPDNVTQNVRRIYLVGQTLGRDPRAFSKLGDSTIENPHFLTRFDDGPYNLGDYGYLQPVIDYFHGSFSRQGVAVQRGLHTWSVFDPMWADPSACLPGEHMLACEFRLHNPSLVFIKLGSNDVGVPDSTERNLRRIVEYCISAGVIPILNTKADRHEGAGNVNNQIIRQIAADYEVPLLDFDVIAQTLPGRGLAFDGVHLTSFFAHDWSSPIALQRGYGVHNLIALIILDRVWQATQ